MTTMLTTTTRSPRDRRPAIYALSILVWLVVFFGVTTSYAQKNTLGEICVNQSDCATGLLCTNVGSRSTCLLACPSGQCLFSETCLPHPTGQKVCKCDATHPCKGGLPCINGACPAFFCEATANPCPPGAPLICFQPIPNVTYGLCIEKCTKDSDCPPPGTRCTPYNTIKICYCRTDSDCKAGLKCTDHHCHTPCTKDSDCPKGEYCTAGNCEPRLPGTEPNGENATEMTTDKAQEPAIDHQDAGESPMVIPEEPSSQEAPPEPRTEPGDEIASSPEKAPHSDATTGERDTPTTQERADQMASDVAKNEPDNAPARDKITPIPDATSLNDPSPKPPSCGCSSDATGSAWLLLGLLSLWLGLGRRSAARKVA